MIELWDNRTCRTCGEKYYFGDGPTCGCRDEKDLWEEEFEKEFKDCLLGE